MKGTEPANDTESARVPWFSARKVARLLQTEIRVLRARAVGLELQWRKMGAFFVLGRCLSTGTMRRASGRSSFASEAAETAISIDIVRPL